MGARTRKSVLSNKIKLCLCSLDVTMSSAAVAVQPKQYIGAPAEKQAAESKMVTRLRKQQIYLIIPSMVI